MKLFCKFEAQKFLKCVCKNDPHSTFLDRKHDPHSTFLDRQCSFLTEKLRVGNFEGKTNLFPEKGKPSEYIENIGHLNVKQFFKKQKQIRTQETKLTAKNQSSTWSPSENKLSGREENIHRVSKMAK